MALHELAQNVKSVNYLLVAGLSFDQHLERRLTHADIDIYRLPMARAATTSDVFNAIGDPTRRRIVEVLSAADASVGDIVAALGVQQPQISKHLKVLKDVDAVHCRSVGRNRVYALHRAGFQPIEDWFERLTVDVNQHFDRLDDYLTDLQRATPKRPGSNHRKEL